MSAARRAPPGRPSVQTAVGCDATAEPPSLLTLFATFAKLGVTSIGGGLTGWIMREIVTRRKWMAEDEFISGLALSQALPGVNVVNLPIWIGYRLRGGPGALAGALGMIVPSMGVISCIAATFGVLTRYPQTHLVLAGAAAAAVGLSLSMGLQAARRTMRTIAGAVVTLVTFVNVGVLKLPMVLVLAVIAPLSILLAWRQVRDAP